MEYSGGAKYDGPIEFGRFDGVGTYEFPDGSKYVGEFRNGQFHGKGTIYSEQGKYEATWTDGKESEGHFTFADGLEYEKEWGYCTDNNRVFYSEARQGIKPAGQLNYTNRGVKHVLPVGHYDTGDGVYRTEINSVTSYDDPKKFVRKPDDEEVVWLRENAISGVH